MGDDTELRLGRTLADRIVRVGPRTVSAERLIAGADVLCACSGGPGFAPGLIRRALADETVPVAAQIDPYVELTRDGELGLMFPPGDAVTLAGQIKRLTEHPALRRDLRGRAKGSIAAVEDVAAGFERLYRTVCARRHDESGNRGAATEGLSPPRDPRRPAHAHRPLIRLRDPGRDAAVDGARGAVWGRSRSPTTTRSRARSPRARSPTSSGSR